MNDTVEVAEVTLTEVNQRITELNKEFQELNILKKELKTKDRKERLESSFSKYKFILREGTVEDFDHNSFLEFPNAQVGFSDIGLPLASDGASIYSIAETQEEAELRIKVDKLMNLTDELKSQFTPTEKDQLKKQYSVAEIYDEYVVRT